MKAITKYLKKRKEAITFLLEKPQQTYTPAVFHKLRVEIKKLNAFFELINFCSKDFKRKKTFKPFKLIFSQAGKVREFQVEEAMLKKYFLNTLLTNYRVGLKQLRLKEQNDFFLIVNKKFYDGLNKKYCKIMNLLKKADIKNVKSYLEKKRKLIKKLLSQDTLQTPQIHALRKSLKTFNYNRKILDLEKNNRPLPKKEILAELLGKWHDCQIIIRHLKKTIDACGINPKEMNQLIKIKAKLFSKSQLVLKKIHEAIPSSEFLAEHNN